MAKQLIFDEEARRSLKKGIDIMAGAVKSTLGPKGRNVALDKKFGAPSVTHDGVTVAKEIQLENPFENMGAQLLKEAATRTNDVAGDGTTTATVLAQSIVNEGLKNLAAGANPMQLKHGIDKGTEAIVEYIRSIAIPIEDKKEIAQIASISAADDQIGNLIAEVMDRVGKEGVITVEASRGINGDYTLFTDAIHHFCYQVTDLIVGCGDRGDLCDLFFIFNGDCYGADILDNSLGTFVDTMLELHRIGTGCQVFQPFIDN